MNNTGKLTALLLVLSMLLMLFVSCGKNKEETDVPDGFVKASNDIANYSLFVPEDWIVDTESGSLMASARENEYSTSNVTMVSYTDNSDRYENVQQYWDSYSGNLIGMFDKAKDEDGNVTEDSSFSMEGEGITGKVDGVDTVKYVYTATLSEIDLQYVQLIAMKGRNIYIFTYTTTPEGYDADTVDSIINNIKFK